ncbi:transcriptional regulator, TetR family [Streptomyces sp. DvalAA-14]|uniref:TetR/AcrR family transcriptional regulator n=1 Tax=unclassified Streptomyces TaxID=2593676 RepID=UPI00081B40E6|nr:MULTISPECIES: TetR/AcrR family transcriptional regulator [unclassified Streptomyces]MYS24992.1 TetR family transcriptional regulator [Streptomyces sp. SID4948]SCE51166.1 transcriptional regulator, TetR family [Streptomyces sp. DvalAA-14]
MEPKPPRPPAGAAVLRAGVTDAIRAAVFEELAAVGYGRMSIENIARRAGVGKAAIYRRWPSKLPIVLEVVSALAVPGLPTPDTGTLLGDLRELLEATARVLRHPLAAQIIPDLLAEAARNPDLALAVRAAVRDTQRAVAAVVVSHAVERGELPPATDVDLALDLATGPLYWRLTTVRTAPPPGYLDALAAATAAALGAAGFPGGEHSTGPAPHPST